MKHSSDVTAPSITSAADSPSVGARRRSPAAPASIFRPGPADIDHGEPETPTGPLLLTLNEVAAELRCARRSVERHIAAHEIRTVRFGRCVRVERAELARFIAGHTERHQEDDDATSA